MDALRKTARRLGRPSDGSDSPTPRSLAHRSWGPQRVLHPGLAAACSLRLPHHTSHTRPSLHRSLSAHVAPVPLPPALYSPPVDAMSQSRALPSSLSLRKGPSRASPLPSRQAPDPKSQPNHRRTRGLVRAASPASSGSPAVGVGSSRGRLSGRGMIGTAGRGGVCGRPRAGAAERARGDRPAGQARRLASVPGRSRRRTAVGEPPAGSHARRSTRTNPAAQAETAQRGATAWANFGRARSS
jgi:hypothetical protein